MGIKVKHKTIHNERISGCHWSFQHQHIIPEINEVTFKILKRKKMWAMFPCGQISCQHTGWKEMAVILYKFRKYCSHKLYLSNLLKNELQPTKKIREVLQFIMLTSIFSDNVDIKQWLKMKIIWAMFMKRRISLLNALKALIRSKRILLNIRYCRKG